MYLIAREMDIRDIGICRGRVMIDIKVCYGKVTIGDKEISTLGYLTRSSCFTWTRYRSVPSPTPTCRVKVGRRAEGIGHRDRTIGRGYFRDPRAKGRDQLHSPRFDVPHVVAVLTVLYNVGALAVGLVGDEKLAYVL